MADLTFIYLILAVFSFNRGYGQVIDVRLVNGTTPNEGTIMYTDDCQIWKTSCGRNLGRNEVDVICRHLGYAGTNSVIMSSSFGKPSPTSHITCNGDEKSVSNCSLAGLMGSMCTSVGGAVCYENNYLGCFKDMTGDRVLEGSANVTLFGLTIDKCLEFCRQDNETVFAGVENSMECFCSDVTSNYSRHGRVPDDECNYQCDGYEYERCGGKDRIAIFNLTADLHLPPNPMSSPCNMTTTPVSIMSSTVTESTVQPTTSQETSSSSGTSDEGPATSIGSGLTGTVSGPGQTSASSSSPVGSTTSTSDEGQTTSIGSGLTGTLTGPDQTSASSSSPVGSTTTSYAAIGGGVAAAVVVCIIIIILVYRFKSKPKQDHKYGHDQEEMAGGQAVSLGYDNTIVAFPEASGSDTWRMNVKDDQQGEIDKDAFTAQMKRGTMLVEYVNMRDRDKPGVMEPESRYENLADDGAGKNAITSKDAVDFDGLYAVSTKHRPGPDGGEEDKDAGIMYAVPEKGRKSKASDDASAPSLPDQSAEAAGDLYAVPEKNRKSRVSQNVPVLPLTDDLDAMYALPKKPRFGQEDDGDTIDMVENDLYGSQGQEDDEDITEMVENDIYGSQ